MNFTAAQIREDMALCHGRLEEKFLKTDDPTMVVGKFLEDAGRCMSSIQKGFNEKAKSRNEIIAPTIKELDKLSGLIGIAKAGLQKHIDGEASPEDDNSSINESLFREVGSISHLEFKERGGSLYLEPDSGMSLKITPKSTKSRGKPDASNSRGAMEYSTKTPMMLAKELKSKIYKPYGHFLKALRDLKSEYRDEAEIIINF